jgi:hypothetical protein
MSNQTQTQTPTPKSEALDLLHTIAEQIHYLVDLVNALADQVTSVTRALDAIAATASQPASHTQSQPNGDYSIFQATELVMSYDDKGNQTYKIKGGPYMTYGVRVWPEVLPALGIDLATLKPGPNPFTQQVRALMGETGPRKIVGLANPQPAPDAHLESAYDERTEEPPF